MDKTVFERGQKGTGIIAPILGFVVALLVGGAMLAQLPDVMNKQSVEQQQEFMALCEAKGGVWSHTFDNGCVGNLRCEYPDGNIRILYCYCYNGSVINYGV